jgi:cbb3-type cytochrome oxidase maturation protein
MAILLLFTAVALAIFTVALAALAWSVRSGQLDDLDTPALRMLTDEGDHDHVPRP